MKEIFIIVLSILFAIVLILIITLLSKKELLDPYPIQSTYVNTPQNVGVYPMMPNTYPDWYALDWKPWRSRYPFLYSPASQVGVGPDWWNVPMLTSVRKPEIIGKWIKIGVAYTNENKPEYIDVYQLTIDPVREIYYYEARTKYRQRIPIEINPYIFKLEDGDKFKLVGNDKLWTFVKNSPYTYIWT
jgi:hypothetical protein